MKTFKKKPTVLEGKNHKFILNKKSKKLIIFFSGTGKNNAKFDFYGIGKDLEANILFLNNGFNEWYQNGIPSLETKTVSETIEIIKSWKEYLHIKEIYTCGASMGAYGAILYGAFLNAKVLAFASELELKLKGGRTLSHMKEDINVSHDILNIMKTSDNAVYIYIGEDDPIDVYHASKVSSFIDYPNVQIFSISETDHAIARFVRKKGKLLLLIEDLIDNKELSSILETNHIVSLIDFPKAYYQEYIHFKDKDWGNAIRKGEEAVGIFEMSPYSQYMLGLSYVQASEFSKGLQHLSIARSLSPLKLDYQFSVANCLRRMGHLDKARYLHQKILQINKDFAKSHYDLSLIYAKKGDKKGAIARAKHALRVEPKNASYQKRVAKLTSEMKK